MGLFRSPTVLHWARWPLICLLCLSAFAPAQNQSDQDVMSLSIEDLANVKVYSASRHEEAARKAPSSMSLVTSDEIRAYGWFTLADLLNSLRGYYTAYDRNYSYLGVRGVQRPGDYNSRILLLIDGHRLNDNVDDGAEIGTEFPLDLDLIDHIEVMRGPGSSLYGTDAVFGIINIITRHSTARATFEVAGDVASFYGRSGRITGSASRGRWSGLISGSLYDTPGQSRLFFPEFASPATNNGFADDLDGDRYAHVFANLQHGNLRLQGLYGSRLKMIPTASYGTNFNDPGSRTIDTHAYFDADYQADLTSRTNLDLRAFYSHYDYNGTYAYGGTNSPDRYLNFDTALADWSGMGATLGHTMGPHHLTLGANYEYSFRVDQGTRYTGFPFVLNDHRTPWLAALYGEAELRVARDLALHLGGRFDYFDIFGHAITPRIALIYSPNPQTALKYIFGRAFRAPNAYESYYRDGMTTEMPLHPLQKESIESHELVFERDLNAWLAITLDGYYNNLDHLIDWVTDPSNQMSHAENVGQDRGRGLELELDAQRASGLEARASYALADAYDVISEQRLNNSPLHQAKLNAMVPATRHLLIGLESAYTSAQSSYQATRVPPRFLTNLTLSTKPLWGGWELSASCYNALDRRWFSPAGLNSPEPAIQQDGRTLRFKISYRLSERSSK
jgi:outer membrane receptor for ferrienterochelin and colicins